MRKRVTSPVHIGVLCLLALGGVAVYGYDSWARDSASQRMLADYLRTERLPDSAHDIECVQSVNRCEPDNPSTMCFVRIEPADLDLLLGQAQFRKNEDACPWHFSHTHQMGLTVGPGFKINEEHWGGTQDARVDVYPDAAHTQFVALLSRPSKSTFHCD
jgi:hypothetical protein